MLAEQAFLWWNYYIIHLHQLSQGISLSLDLSRQCNWPANQIQIVMRAGGGKRSFPSMQIHNQIKFSSVKRKLLIAIFQFSNFLRHSCSNSRKFSPSLPFNKLNWVAQGNRTHKQDSHSGPHTAKYETEAISATLNRNSWDNQRHYLTIMCWKFHENCTKTKHRLTRCEKRKQKTEQREKERERKNLIELDPDDREMMTMFMMMSEHPSASALVGSSFCKWETSSSPRSLEVYPRP